MKFFEVLCLVVVLDFSSAFPNAGYYPRAYMIGSSFYANPRYVRQGPGYEYIPPGQMTAMVLGDTVATNTYSGPAFNPPHAVLTGPNTDVGQIEDDQITEQVTDKQQPILVAVPEPDSINETEPQEDLHSEQPVQNFAGEQETLFSLEEGTTEAVVVATTKAPVVPTRAPSTDRKTKTLKAKKPATTAAPQPAEEEDDEEDAGLPASWPFNGSGRAGIPNYNAFFPIFIGGSSPSGRSRTRSADGEYQEGGYPGSATAIANAFSTGKGGSATSHATSFGDPYAAAMFRNAGLYNFKTKATKKQALLEEDD